MKFQNTIRWDNKKITVVAKQVNEKVIWWSFKTKVQNSQFKNTGEYKINIFLKPSMVYELKKVYTTNLQRAQYIEQIYITET